MWNYPQILWGLGVWLLACTTSGASAADVERMSSRQPDTRSRALFEICAVKDATVHEGATRRPPTELPVFQARPEKPARPMGRTILLPSGCAEHGNRPAADTQPGLYVLPTPGLSAAQRCVALCRFLL